MTSWDVGMLYLIVVALSCCTLCFSATAWVSSSALVAYKDKDQKMDKTLQGG